MSKYTYAKKTANGVYVEFDEPISNELNSNDIGYTYEDYENNKWILLNERHFGFLEKYPGASIKEVINLQLDEVSMHERTLEDAKIEKIRELETYDKSSSINDFIVILSNEEEIHGWFTPEERSNYRNSIDAAKTLNVEILSLYIDTNKLTLYTSLAEQLLAQIQLYADACSIVTQQHKLNISRLTTIEQVDNYDYTILYPEKLIFNI